MEVTLSTQPDGQESPYPIRDLTLHIADRFPELQLRFYDQFSHEPTGAILFLYYTARIHGTDRYDDYIQELLVATFRNLIKTKKLGEENVIAGNAWLFSHLADKGFIDIQLDNLFETIDMLICHDLQTKFSKYVINGGLLSKSGYVTDRLRNTSDRLMHIKFNETLAFVLEEIEYRMKGLSKTMLSAALPEDQIPFRELDELSRSLYYLNKVHPDTIYVAKRTEIHTHMINLLRPSLEKMAGANNDSLRPLEKMVLTMGIHNNLLAGIGNLQLPATLPDMTGYFQRLDLATIRAAALKDVYNAIKYMKLLLSVKQLYGSIKAYQEVLHTLYDVLSHIAFNTAPGYFFSDVGFPNTGISGAAGIGLVLLEFESDTRIDWEDAFMLYA